MLLLIQRKDVQLDVSQFDRVAQVAPLCPRILNPDTVMQIRKAPATGSVQILDVKLSTLVGKIVVHLVISRDTQPINSSEASQKS